MSSVPQLKVSIKTIIAHYGQKHDVVVVNFLNKKNAADQRVYQLLSEKFKLFEGVFGASDEVLGTIESGVDFERRIAQIYQDCRTEEEIQAAFDALQKDMEAEIDETMNITRQKLLENFDEEVHEKLKVNRRESREYLSRYESWLWEVTRYYLASYADFSSEDHSFVLNRNPFSEEPIHPGPYRIGKNVEDTNIYRVGHPLARGIIEACASPPLPTGGTRLPVLYHPQKDYHPGTLCRLFRLVVRHKCLHQLIRDRRPHHIHRLRRWWQRTRRRAMQPALLPARGDGRNWRLAGPRQRGPGGLEARIAELDRAREAEILAECAQRNSGFFDAEMEKLDKWAEDVKNSIEIELKERDLEIKLRKTEAKKILSLEEKVRAQREIKEMEKTRNTLRQNLFQAQDEVDAKKEKLIDEIEARLTQKVTKDRLFLVRWTIE